MVLPNRTFVILSAVGIWASSVAAFTPSARWGAASTIYTSSSSSTPYLLLLGGKSDPTSAYTYSSSPALTSSSFTSSSDDSSLLALDLSSNFSTSSPAWIALDDTSAPVTVWGVMSSSMVYGGDGGTSLAIQTGNDSLYTFTSPSSISSTSALTFAQASSGTEGQPIRTIYSAISTSADGSVSYITGGEKDDGSGTGYSLAYKVTTTSSTTTFTQLPDLPTDLCHHKMILLANGTLITVGGYIPSTATFISMTTGYTLDTTSSSASWQTVSLGSSGSAPAGRRGHAAVLLNVPSSTAETESLQTVARRDQQGRLQPRADAETYSETIIVHGGTSGVLLGGTPLSDLWTMNLSTSSPSWTSISSSTSTSAPSARVDAIAQPVGYQLLIFGGYGSAGPADDALYVYDALNGDWTDTFDTAGTDWTAEELAAESGSVATGTATATATGGSATTGTAAATASTGTGSTHTMGPTQTGFPTGSATAAAVTTGSGRTTSTTSKSSSSGTSSATSTAVSTTRLSSNTTAIAVGTSLGVLAALSGLVAILFVVRRRRRGTNGRFQPYGSKRPVYRRKGDGAEALMTEKDYAWQPEDYLALGGEKRMASVNAASDYSGVMGTMDRPVAMARYSGDREGNIIRRDMLEDEDRSYRRNPSGGGPGGEDDDTASILRYGDEYEDEDDIAGPSRLYQNDRGPRVAVAVPTRPPSERTPTVDPFEDSYGAPVLDYVYGGEGQYLDLPAGNSRHGSHSPVSSTGSAHGSSLGRIETARKVSLAKGNAAVVPVTRGQSMLKRLNIPSFFGAGVASSDRRGFATLGDERGFMDPSTPPAMAPLGMRDSMYDDADACRGATGPSAWSAAARNPVEHGHDIQDQRRAQLASDMSRHGRSVSSVTTARTADSEALERYQRMNIVQRERTSSSGREEEDGSDAASLEEPVASSRPAYQKPLPTRPPSPTRPRTVDTPRGPRPASPTRQPSSPIRPYITAPAPATPSRRHVKDMAASINRRDTREDYSTDLFVPSPMMASAATLASGSGPMMSPSRGIGFGSAAGAPMGSPGGMGRAMGPRGPKKVYEYQERGELRVANR